MIAHPQLPRAPRPLTDEARAFWEPTWARLDKAERTTRRGDSWQRLVAELRDAAVERRIVGLSRSDEQDLFRTRLLQWYLERLEGRPEGPVDPPRASVAWLGPEPWLAARALPPGAVRCEAMLFALDDAATPDRAFRVATAEAQAREELANANVTGAFALAARVDTLEPSIARLALRAWTAAQAGRAAELVPVWRARADAAALGPDEAATRVVGAKLALARGDVFAARPELGAALALSSPEAAALTARLLVAGDEPRRARVLARAWIDDPSARDVPGALWALACLAEPYAPVPAKPGADAARRTDPPVR